MNERLECRRHDQIDEEDRQRHREAQAGERGLHLLVLAAEFGGHTGRRRRYRQCALDVTDYATQAAALEIGRDYRRTLLLLPGTASIETAASRRPTSGTPRRRDAPPLDANSTDPLAERPEFFAFCIRYLANTCGHPFFVLKL